MQKVIRDNRNYPVGFSDTRFGKGTFAEFCDKAGYTHQGCVAETIQSLDINERDYIIDKGELF